jgi:hypothetical protein
MTRLRPGIGLLLAFVLALSACASATGTRSGDPLPSGNDGPAKHAIVGFVRRVTTEGGPDFVPVEDRIATFARRPERMDGQS